MKNKIFIAKNNFIACSKQCYGGIMKNKCLIFFCLLLLVVLCSAFTKRVLDFIAPTVLNESDVNADNEPGMIVYDMNEDAFYGRGNGTTWKKLSFSESDLNSSLCTESSNYTILDDDGCGTIIIDNTTSNRTITLPSVANNANRVITIKNISSNQNKVTVTRSGSATIDGYTSIDLDFKQAYIEIQCDGTNWFIIGENITSVQKRYTLTVTGTDWTTIKATGVPYRDIEGTWRLIFNISGTVTSSSRTSYTATISGITFDASHAQDISGHPSTSTGAVHLARANQNTNTVGVYHPTITTTGYLYSGDVELASKPTFVE